MMKYNRLQRLMAAKQAEFDAIPPHQQERLRTAFNRAREDTGTEIIDVYLDKFGRDW